MTNTETYIAEGCRTFEIDKYGNKMPHMIVGSKEEANAIAKRLNDRKGA